MFIEEEIEGTDRFYSIMANFINNECVICRKAITGKNVKCFYCGIEYHYNCVKEWISEYNNCPTCMNFYVVPKQCAVEV